MAHDAVLHAPETNNPELLPGAVGILGQVTSRDHARAIGAEPDSADTFVVGGIRKLHQDFAIGHPPERSLIGVAVPRCDGGGVRSESRRGKAPDGATGKGGDDRTVLAQLDRDGALADRRLVKALRREIDRGRDDVITTAGAEDDAELFQAKARHDLASNGGDQLRVGREEHNAVAVKADDDRAEPNAVSRAINAVVEALVNTMDGEQLSVVRVDGLVATAAVLRPENGIDQCSIRGLTSAEPAVRRTHGHLPDRVRAPPDSDDTVGKSTRCGDFP